MSDTKAKIIQMYSNVPEAAPDLYRDVHVMTNKELLGQVYMFAAEIQKYYLSTDTPISISTVSMPSNGVRLVVRLLDCVDDHIGFAGTFYSISRRLKIIEQICDMFESGAKVLSDEDFYTHKTAPAFATN